MAQYQHLPIYKQTYDLLLRTMTATKDFPREYKYTLGQKIKEELIELGVMIYRANSAQDKARHSLCHRIGNKLFIHADADYTKIIPAIRERPQ